MNPGRSRGRLGSPSAQHKRARSAPWPLRTGPDPPVTAPLETRRLAVLLRSTVRGILHAPFDDSALAPAASALAGGGGPEVCEAMVCPGSPLAGPSIWEVSLRSRCNAAVVAAQRRGEHIERDSDGRQQMEGAEKTHRLYQRGLRPPACEPRIAPVTVYVLLTAGAQSPFGPTAVDSHATANGAAFADLDSHSTPCP